MNTQTQAKENPKKTYTSPRLINYGAVRSLTQAGSTGPNESSGMLAFRMQASDRMTKENIVQVGTHPLGIGLYLFDYKPGYCEEYGFGRQFGVMADEVETLMPEAVSVHPDGYKMVNYAMMGISHRIQ